METQAGEDDLKARRRAVFVKAGAARQVERVAEQLERQITQLLGESSEEPLDDQLQQALLAAFPDRLARRRGPHDARGLMVGGRGVKLDTTSGVRESELFLCASTWMPSVVKPLSGRHHRLNHTGCRSSI